MNKATCSLQGSITRSILKNFYVDVALLSCKALNFESWIFDSNFDSNNEEAEIKKLMIERAQKLLCWLTTRNLIKPRLPN